MSLRDVRAALFALAVAIVAIVVIANDGGAYKVVVQLSNADGLDAGSKVKIGGVAVGSVSSIRLGRGDAVLADVAVNPGHAITSGASAQIVPDDLLGSMYLEITPGSGTQLPSGSTIPASRVTHPVQLDQVLNVLDANTRAKLAVLIDEAGTALTGRRADFNKLLALLPNTFGTGANLLQQLNTDNHALSTLVAQSDQFMTTLIPQDHSLTDLIHAAGQTMHTTAANETSLREIFDRAPATLASAQRFLTQLQSTAEPLGPAARAITETAPQLTATLDQVPGFQAAAEPALNRATAVAPLLSRLAVKATPVITAAVPTAQALDIVAGDAKPATYAVGMSINNLLGLIEGWARAIQGRDRIGHLFHGRGLVGPELITSLLNSVKPTGISPLRHRASPTAPATGSLPHPQPAASTNPIAAIVPTPARPVMSGLLAGAGGAVSKLTGILGQLLGGLHGLDRLDRPDGLDAFKPHTGRGRERPQSPPRLPPRAMTTFRPRFLRTRGRRGRRRDTQSPTFVVLSGAIVSAILIGIIAFAISAPNGLFFKSYRTLYVSVPDPGNLLPHSDVRVRGLLVGQVINVNSNHNRALVDIQLNASTPPLPIDTTVLIRAQGLLGQRYVQLVPGHGPRMLADGATLNAPAQALTYGVPDALDTFNRQTRGGLGSMLDSLGVGLLGRGPGINAAIAVGPGTTGDFITAADAILGRPGAAARLIPSLQSGAGALDRSRYDLVGALHPGLQALQPFVDHSSAFANTLQQTPPTLATAQSALQHGTRLLQAAASLATAAAHTLPAAPVGLRDATILLRTSHLSLSRAAGLLRAVQPSVPAVLHITSALSPLLQPLRTAFTSLDPIITNLGQHGCDIYDMASNWRSALGYGVPNGSGAALPSGDIGAAGFFRVSIIAGPASIHGIAQPNLDPGTIDVYPTPCKYAPGPKYFDPLNPSANGHG